MNLTRALWPAIRTFIHAADKPIVFVVDDDISVRESLELLIASAGWQPEISRQPRNSFIVHEAPFQTVLCWTLSSGSERPGASEAYCR